MKSISLISCLLYCIITLPVISYGQESNGEQRTTCEKTMNAGKYKILSESPGGEETQFYLEIKPKYRTDENYIAIAKEFKEKYCHTNRLRVIYLTGKKQWLILDPLDPKATPLAIFYKGIGTDEKDGLDVYTVVDGKVRTRQLDLAQ